jgi:hypothetical protein
LKIALLKHYKVMVSLRLVAAPTWMPENDYQAATRIVVSGEAPKFFWECQRQREGKREMGQPVL